MADPGDWAFLIRDHKLAKLLAVKSSLTKEDCETLSGRELNGNLLEALNDQLFKTIVGNYDNREAVARITSLTKEDLDA